MRGSTHALAGAASASIFLYFNIPHNYPLLALSAIAGFAALLPDLDGRESTIENIRVFGVRIMKAPGYVIDRLFKHRGFLHSLMGLGLLAFILLGFLPALPKEIVIAILLGCLSHLLTDGITPAGVPWLYPLDWSPPLFSKYFAITTGSFMETVFFIGLVVFYLIFLSQAGYVSFF